MKHITKIAVVENATSIWEYDPSREDNRVLGESLDVIAAIQTLAIKVCFMFYLSLLLLIGSKISHQIQASGQRIEEFQNTQIRCGFPDALKIPLHSNIRWGTAFEMLDQANRLRQVILSTYNFISVLILNLSQLAYLYRPRIKYLAQLPRYAVKTEL